MKNKTITIEANKPLSAHDTFKICYCVYRDFDVIEPRHVIFRIEGESSDPNARPGRMNYADEEDFILRTFWVKEPLSVGDSLYFYSKPTHDLSIAMGNDPEERMLITIGAFYQVQPDGSLVCTGT